MVGVLRGKRIAWRWAAASRTGTSHIRSETRRQDAFAARLLVGGQLFAMVADGAGSASYGGQGAWLLCRHLTKAFRVWFAENSGLPSDDQAITWLNNYRDMISIIASSRGADRREFASTLVLLTVASGKLLGLQIGDSALVGRSSGGWEALFWPKNGEYASSTFFVTDDPTPRLHIVRQPLDFDAFALFSDGVGDLALDQCELKPHQPFFDPMIKPIDRSRSVGRLPSMSCALESFLDSPNVCERTDDDKTLILISGSTDEED